MADASRWKSIVRPLWNYVRTASIVDGNADLAKTVFLSSGARTGSTWVSEIINFDNGYRFLFEPFSRVVPLRPSWAPRLEPDDRLRYIRPECDDLDLIAQASRVLSGSFRHPEVDQYNYNMRIAFDRRLVKETKSNLFLKWLHVHFPQVKLILLMRHPIPTIMSRRPQYFDLPPGQRAVADDVEMRGRNYSALTLSQPELLQDFLEPFRPVMESATTVFAQRVVEWSIQNYVPLHQFAPGEVHLIFYEDFCIDPVRQMRRLREFLGTELREDEAERIRSRSRQPSSTVHRTAVHGYREPSEIEGYEQIAKWTKRVQPDEQRDAARILQAFGLDGVYNVTDPMPDSEGAANLMRANTALSSTPTISN